MSHTRLAGQLLAGTLAIGASILFGLGQARAADFYGVGLNADGLANLEVGSAKHRMSDYRFRAQRTGTADKVRVFFATSAGYGAGNGGTIKVELRTDDGTSNHWPSSTVLATATAVNPINQSFALLAFDHGASISAGALYHLRFSNVAADPVANFVSSDELYTPAATSPQQPTVSDVDLAALYSDSDGSSWTHNLSHTPCFSLYLTDGSGMGVAYVNARSQSGVLSISGSSKVRESFTVSGGDRTATKASVRVAKTGSGGGLTIRLESSAGALIEEGTVAESSIGNSMTWASYTFSSPRVLTSGASYHLVLSASGGSYTTYGLTDGESYGFHKDASFTDGTLESTSGSSWQGDGDDLQFYFTLASTSSGSADGGAQPVADASPHPAGDGSTHEAADGSNHGAVDRGAHADPARGEAGGCQYLPLRTGATAGWLAFPALLVLCVLGRIRLSRRAGRQRYPTR